MDRLPGFSCLHSSMFLQVIGVRGINQITITERFDASLQGATVATIKHLDYIVQMYMPVDGRIMHINDIVFKG
jgi:hypothetical protein